MSILNKKDKYKSHLKIVQNIILSFDPVGLIKDGAPEDEYSGEITKIVSRISKSESKNELGEVIYNIFVENFDEDSVGDKSLYVTMAEKILTAIEELGDVV